MSVPLLDKLDLFYGAMNQQLAHVYARLPFANESSGMVLRGSIRGPTSQLTRTLPATVPIVDLGPGPNLLSRASLPDPCFWGPHSPYLYEVTVELWQGQRLVETVSRPFGMRMMQVSQGQLTLETERWRIQAFRFDEATDASLEPWPDSKVAALVTNPSDQLCEAASRSGTPIIAWTEVPVDDLIGEIRRLAQWPAVSILVLQSEQPIELELRDVAPNLLFAEHLPNAQMHNIQRSSLATWAHLAVCDVDRHDVDPLKQLPKWLKETAIPVLARVRGTTEPSETLTEAIDQCRQFQRRCRTAGQVCNLSGILDHCPLAGLLWLC